jgi:hypothetical protein
MAGTRRQPHLAEMARQNPAVDAEQVRQVNALIAELRRTGVEASEYRIESPYERRSSMRREPQRVVERDARRQ